MRHQAIHILVMGCLVAASCGAADSATDTQSETAAGEATSSTPATVPPPTSTTSAATTGLATTETPSTGQGCDVLHAPGEYEGLNVVGEVEQGYWVVVPESYAEVVPAPLYLHLASGGGDHDGFLNGWRPYLNDLDGLMVMVNMAPGPAGKRSSATMLALIDQVSGNYCVDPTRVHIMGTSMAADMAHRMACEASDRIASFVASGLWNASTPCEPPRPVPLWTFTGDPDRQTVTAFVDKWAAINGCNPEPVVEHLGSGVSRKIYQNCEADVVFYDIEGMGHVWPMNEAKGPGAQWVAEYEEVDYLEDTLQFFADHPLP